MEFIKLTTSTTKFPYHLVTRTSTYRATRNDAEARLKQLSRRFAIDAKYKEDYVTFMLKMIKEGHAEKAPEQRETA